MQYSAILKFEITILEDNEIKYNGLEEAEAEQENDGDDDFIMDSGNELYDLTCNSNVPSFEAMTADEIMNLMKYYIEEVESIVEVRVFVYFCFRLIYSRLLCCCSANFQTDKI